MSRVTRRAEATGATVYAMVTAEFVGQAIHRLEYRADIVLIGRVRSKTQRLEIFKLRSDLFPAAWDRKYVQLYFHKDDDGLDIELATP